MQFMGVPFARPEVKTHVTEERKKKNVFRQLHCIYSDNILQAMNQTKGLRRTMPWPHRKFLNTEPENIFGRWLMHRLQPAGFNPYAYMWKTLQGSLCESSKI
jgi:hypothetical protein